MTRGRAPPGALLLPSTLRAAIDVEPDAVDPTAASDRANAGEAAANECAQGGRDHPRRRQQDEGRDPSVAKSTAPPSRVQADEEDRPHRRSDENGRKTTRRETEREKRQRGERNGHCCAPKGRRRVCRSTRPVPVAAEWVPKMQ